jgi:hypothetical protein
MSEEKVYTISDFSGGIVRKPSKFLKQENNVDLAINADFSRIGAVQKVKGYTQKGNDVPTAGATTTSTSSSSSSTSSSSTTTAA